VEALELLPTTAWDTQFYAHWQPGEAGASRQLQAFLDNAILDYADDRDRPALRGTSRLSPHLHFGEISALQVWQRVQDWAAQQTGSGVIAAAEAFLRQLAWRDFAHHLLFHFPHTQDAPLDERYRAFPWRRQYGADLSAWQRGRTGIPIVDAGMRELWATGWMHNRVRMITASLLTKNLLIPWQQGAAWFWDTLVDADLANNCFGWQWTAGCGADAAPYFRIFNPVTQGERFDPDGSYVRRWVPELQHLPPRWIQQPWQAPATVLAAAAVELGATYPWPIVDLKATRERALAAWEQVKQQRG
jgi:deoxyribodipyrimidine photo-lyase